jgi:hypothetical protein
MSKFISAGNRGSDEKPITIDMLSKSIFACFLYREPVEDNMATDAYLRQAEVENTLALMNMLHDLALHAWNAKGAPSDTMQRKLRRMFSSKSIMAWAELLQDAVAAKLDLLEREDKARPFYRQLTKDQIGQVKTVVSRLVGWKFWSDASDDIDRVLKDNKSEVKDWFRGHGLTPGYLLGATS